MKIILLFVVLCLSVLVNGSRHNHHSHSGRHNHHSHGDHIGYYWDDYKRNRLLKGVVAGKDIRNKEIYIGIAKHVEGNKEFLVPGVIYPWDAEEHMTYEWNKGPQTVTEGFRMLYSDYLDHMVWIQTNANDVRHLIHDKELISAGYDEEHNKYYIGRIQIDGLYYAGKIIISNIDDKNGFHCLTKTGYLHTNEFEVLTHQMK
ncbi:hypothetical protein RI129_001162 [Pyrocoelia pectoralis]|uniref:Uncharacterized protein n=1 Tax=Pyrocoelia pectoralis TaxID=417401 RepID=A0AAN7VUS5_9COLE